MHRQRSPWQGFEPRALVAAAAAAVVAAMLARIGGPPAAAVACTAAVLLALARGAGAFLLAIPAALGALPLEPRTPPWPPTGAVRVEGRVLSGIRRDRVQGKTTFTAEHHGESFMVTVAGMPRVLPGDVITGPGHIAAQPRRRLDARLPVVEMPAQSLEIAAGAPVPARLIEDLRLALEDSLLDAVPGREGVLLCHLILGRGPPMDEALRAAHRATGLSHLLAVSGAHASLLGWMLGVAYGIWRRRPALSSRRYRLCCGILLVLYGFLTGMQPPVLRAVAAFGLLLLAAPRSVRVASALALPALLTALLDPDDLLGVSFCLSYAAVVGLALASVWRARSWRERLLLVPLRASFWAMLTTMPLTLLWFGQLAPWTLLGTPLLAPLVGVLLGAGLLLAMCGCVVPGLAALLAEPLAQLAWLYCEAVQVLARLPCAPIFALTRPSPLLMIGMACIGAAWLVARPRRSSVAVLCVALSLPHFVPLGSGLVPRLELLAVGHGQACLVHRPDGRVLLVDCGSLGDPLRAAHVVDRALNERRRIDLLVLTHGDFDHTGGVDRLLQLVPITAAALPAELSSSALAHRLRAGGTRLLPIAAGEERSLADGVRVRRPKSTAESANESSLWVRIELCTFTAIVPGDALEHGTRAWLHDEIDARADVLVLPHHGRANACAAELIERVQPSLVLVSNRDGEGVTAQATVAAAHGVRVVHTGSVGTITVSGDDVSVRAERPEPLQRGGK